MKPSILLCIILKIILCMKTGCVQGESLVMKEDRQYTNVTKLTGSIPDNPVESNITENNCAPSPPPRQSQITHIYMGVLFIFFIIFCCIMLAK